ALNVDLSGVNKLSLSFWMWWDTFANDDDLAFEFTANYGVATGGFLVDPNSGTIPNKFEVALRGDVGTCAANFTRPSAAAWHHYTILLDKSASSHEVAAVYVDGSSQTLSYTFDSDNTNNFANSTLNFMSRNNSALFGAGRMCEVAIYPGLLLSTSQITTLADGFAPTVVAPTSKPY